MKHYLINSKEIIIHTYNTFDRAVIRTDIINYLKINTKEQLTHEKECKNDYNDILGIYENNPKSGIASKVITKGNRDFYLPLIAV